MTCEQCLELMQDLVDGELSAADAAVVRQHLAQCLSCAREHRTWEQVSSVLRAEDEAPPPAAIEALKARIQVAAARGGVETELLTVEELAASLRMSPGWVESNLDDIPHLYLGGHLRFRRESIRRWLAQKQDAQRRIRRRLEMLGPCPEPGSAWALPGGVWLPAVAPEHN